MPSQPHPCLPGRRSLGGSGWLEPGLAGARGQPLHESSLLSAQMLVAPLSCRGSSPAGELYKNLRGWMRAGPFRGERGGRVSLSVPEPRPLVSAAPPPSAPLPGPACLRAVCLWQPGRVSAAQLWSPQIYTLRGETNNIRFPRVTLLGRSAAARPPVRPCLLRCALPSHVLLGY